VFTKGECCVDWFKRQTKEKVLLDFRLHVF
jgi:hypothetical protein